MDARVIQIDRPIYVDLDGTLVKTDLLWESVFLLARQKPGALWRLPFWAMRGRACLKAELARRIDFDAALLPYRTEVVEELRAARTAGRKIVVATSANERLAEDVAEHLGLFDAVLASSDTVDLDPQRRLRAIAAENEAAGFDYYGSARKDVGLLEAAAEAVVVAPDREASSWQRSSGAQLLPADRSDVWKGCVKAMRPHQWMKNLLVFVPLVLTHEFLNAAMIGAGAIAFLSFSFAASAVYILNDLLDLTSDRRHKSKRRRPFASGTVPIPVGLTLAGGLFAASVGLALLLGWEFQLVLAGYLVATTLYSLFLKRMLLIDVLTLAALYTVRIIAGAAAADVESSFWLMAFSGFFFLSLALVKRFTELLEFGAGAERSKTGRGYRDVDLDMLGQAGISSGFASVLVLALYIDSAEVRQLYDVPWLLWPLCPLVLYIIVRIWILARRNEMHEDPVVFILRDWRSQAIVATGAALFFLAAYA